MAMIRTILSDLGIPETASGVRFILMLAGLIACIAITVFVLGTTAFRKYHRLNMARSLFWGSPSLRWKPGPLARDGKVTNADLLLSLVFIGMALWSSIYFLNNYF